MDKNKAQNGLKHIDFILGKNIKSYQEFLKKELNKVNFQDFITQNYIPRPYAEPLWDKNSALLLMLTSEHKQGYVKLEARMPLGNTESLIGLITYNSKKNDEEDSYNNDFDEEDYNYNDKIELNYEDTHKKLNSFNGLYNIQLPNNPEFDLERKMGHFSNKQEAFAFATNEFSQRIQEIKAFVKKFGLSTY